MRFALALAALAVSAPASGLHGTVTRGPVTPVCMEGVPCSAPASHVRIVFARTALTRSVVTDADGRFSIRLAAGRWTVRIPGARVFQPRFVTVPRGRLGAVVIRIDTGIR